MALRSASLSDKPKLLLITAHPDDECMFFLPTLKTYLKQGNEVHILCLSTGNADGLGPVRRQEMSHACSLLNINSTCVTTVDDPQLPDGQNMPWSTSAVAHHVKSAMTRIIPSTVVTFDSGGVSWHLNHIDTCAGVRAAIEELREENRDLRSLELLLLDTSSLPTKYIGPLGIIFALLLRLFQSKSICCIGGGPVLAWKCLAAHNSQFVWFRKLFIIFSRYIYVNTLHRC